MCSTLEIMWCRFSFLKGLLYRKEWNLPEYLEELPILWETMVTKTLKKKEFLVSKSWAGLESIFLASANDICSHLPEDTKRFEGIDSDCKE